MIYSDLYINLLLINIIEIIIALQVLLYIILSLCISNVAISVAKRHGADGTATAAGAAVYDFDANWHRRAKNLIGIN